MLTGWRLRRAVRCAETIVVSNREAYYGWSNEVPELVQSVTSQFASDCVPTNCKNPILSVVSDNVAKGSYQDQKEEVWGDSIQIHLGSDPVPREAVVPVKGRSRGIAETRASLVISQGVSGHIAAFVYPPHSDVLKPEKSAYLVEMWSSPQKLRKRHIKRLLLFLYKVDLFCRTEAFPNRVGERLSGTLRVREAVLAEGGSRIWVWIKYAYRAVAGGLRIYGVGAPRLP